MLPARGVKEEVGVEPHLVERQRQHPRLRPPPHAALERRATETRLCQLKKTVLLRCRSRTSDYTLLVRLLGLDKGMWSSSPEAR